MPTDIDGNHNIIAHELHLHGDRAAKVAKKLIAQAPPTPRRAAACVGLAIAACSGALLIGVCATTAAVVATTLLLPVSVALLRSA